MARIQFPTNKTNGTEHTHGNRKYRFDGKRWKKVNTAAENAQANISSAFNQKQAEIDTAKAAMEADIAAKKAAMEADIDAKKAQLDSSVNTINSTVSGLNSTVTNNSNAISSLQSTISTVQTQMQNVGSSKNFCSDENWTVSGAVSSMPDVAGTGGAFSANGTSAENRTEYGTGPHGDWRILWSAKGNDAASDADGGWNKGISGLTSTKGQMSVVYVKRVLTGTSGTFYHGCGQGSVTQNLNGSTNSNPYFNVTNIGNLPLNVWCVSIGFIQSSSDTTQEPNNATGIYRLDTGARIHHGTTYKMAPGATTTQSRVYLYYSNGSSNALQFADPGHYQLDSDTPKVGALAGAAGVGARSCTVFTSSGTWTKPSWCSKIKVEVVGGGGGASGYSESGGAGGYACEIITNPSQTVSVTVGGGGGSTQYYAAAGNGGTSSFGSYCSASGGYGANRNYGHSGGHGGVGSGAHVNIRGGGGTGHTNSNASGSPAKGGGSYMGGGTGDRRDATNAKVHVGAPGSGGPGSRGDTGWRGAPGETGIVIVWEYE